MNSRLLAIIAVVCLLVASCGLSGDDASSSASDDGAGESRETQPTATFAASFDEAMEEDDGAMSEEESIDLATGLDASGNARLAQGVPLSASNSVDDSDNKVDAAQTENPTAEEAETQSRPVDTGRDIIRTAIVSAEVPDVALAAQEVINSVEKVGGLLFNQDTRIAAAGAPNRTTLVFRVPPSDFQSVLNDLSGIGTLLEKRVDATDVTGRVVDLQSRITSTETSVERLRGFLAGATDLNQVATFENELRNRETDLESLRGQLRTIQNQVALSTITITLVEEIAPAKPAPSVLLRTAFYNGHDGGFSCGSAIERAESGSNLTVCYTVDNQGQTALTDLNLRDAALDLEIGDLKLAEGSLDEPMQPGQRVVFYSELTADGTRLLSTAKVQAKAIPTADAPDIEIATDTATDATNLSISVFPKQTDAGFGDGLTSGWDAFTNAVRVVLVVLGFLLPFVWVFPLAFFAFRAWRRRENERKRRFAPAPPTVETAVEREPEPVG